MWIDIGHLFSDLHVHKGKQLQRSQTSKNTSKLTCYFGAATYASSCGITVDCSLNFKRKKESNHFPKCQPRCQPTECLNRTYDTVGLTCPLTTLPSKGLHRSNTGISPRGLQSTDPLNCSSERLSKFHQVWGVFVPCSQSNLAN